LIVASHLYQFCWHLNYSIVHKFFKLVEHVYNRLNSNHEPKSIHMNCSPINPNINQH